MTEPFDALIVGAGPAAISAAWPLAKTGHRIGIVDAGLPEPVALQQRQRSLYDIRTSPPELQSGQAAGDANLSPRVRLLKKHAATESYLGANGISCRDFTAVGALAQGGLSTVWGASVACFSEDDMESWPISGLDLDTGYIAVATRIGISGEDDDAMADVLGRGLPMDPALPPSGVAADLLARHDRIRPADLLVGKARNAVITRDRPPRHACVLDKYCVL